MEAQELEVTEPETVDDLRDALGLPPEEDVWEHVEGEVWTIKELRQLFGLGDQASRNRAWAAVKAGKMEAGKVQLRRGHFVDAFRLKDT